MPTISLESEVDVDGFLDAIRPSIAARIPISDIEWVTPDQPPSLFAESESQSSKSSAKIKVSKGFIDLARQVLTIRDPSRLDHLYAVLLKLQTRPDYLSNRLDQDVAWCQENAKHVRRDLHKMHAFVRFRKVGSRAEREIFVAWFEPEHRITHLAAPFFVKRFTGMDWTIMTPDQCISWDGENLEFAPGVDRSQAPDEDIIEDQWKTYFSSIFNPARLKIGAMMSEMPKKYWKNMPETELIPHLIQTATERQSELIANAPTLPNILTNKVAHMLPERPEASSDFQSLGEVKESAKFCQQCDLCLDATQTVFGEGPVDAKIMIVGEQPGDQEDLAGQPFIGPAGNVLNHALAKAGIARDEVYLTNAVKHFRYEPRGKNRIHKRPSARHIDKCRWWLNLERRFVEPQLIITLGVSALRGVTGKSLKISDVRGQIMAFSDGAVLMPTIHPSYLLRLTAETDKRREYHRFVAELRSAVSQVLMNETAVN